MPDQNTNGVVSEITLKSYNSDTKEYIDVTKKIAVLAENVDGTVNSAKALYGTYTNNNNETTEGLLNIGSVSAPVYFENGIPKVANNISLYNGAKGITVSNGEIGHTNKAITAGSVGPTANAKIGINVPYIEYDNYGHITKTNTQALQIPKGSTSEAGLVQIGDNISVSSGTISIAKASENNGGFYYIEKDDYIELTELLNMITISNN